MRELELLYLIVIPYTYPTLPVPPFFLENLQEDEDEDQGMPSLLFFSCCVGVTLLLI